MDLDENHMIKKLMEISESAQWMVGAKVLAGLERSLRYALVKAITRIALQQLHVSGYIVGSIYLSFKNAL
jgi:hypothetical protein